MKISPLAGKPAPAGILVNVPRLVTAYYTGVPDPMAPAQRVAFGTSGHRGSPFNLAFNEWHILVITQVICLYRKSKNIVGPLYLGIDTHALSVPACASALEVLAGNGVAVMFAEGDEYTPTPVIGASVYERIDSPATPEQEKQLATLSPEQVEQTELAGEKIGGMLTPAPGNEAPIRGLKVIAKSGWFAARPSGTENIYKIYTESFQGTDHLRRIPEEAQTIVSKAIAAAPNPKKDSRGK